MQRAFTNKWHNLYFFLSSFAGVLRMRWQHMWMKMTSRVWLARYVYFILLCNLECSLIQILLRDSKWCAVVPQVPFLTLFYETILSLGVKSPAAGFDPATEQGNFSNIKWRIAFSLLSTFSSLYFFPSWPLAFIVLLSGPALAFTTVPQPHQLQHHQPFTPHHRSHHRRFCCYCQGQCYQPQHKWVQPQQRLRWRSGASTGCGKEALFVLRAFARQSQQECFEYQCGK